MQSFSEVQNLHRKQVHVSSSLAIVSISISIAIGDGTETRSTWAFTGRMPLKQWTEKSQEKRFILALQQRSFVYQSNYFNKLRSVISIQLTYESLVVL